MIAEQITSAQFAELQQKLAAAGIQIPGASGTLTHAGVTALYRFDAPLAAGALGTLSFSVLSAPLGMKGVAEHRIQGAIAEALK